MSGQHWGDKVATHAQAQPVPVRLKDAFRLVFGVASVPTLEAVWKSSVGANPVTDSRTAFMRGLAYWLPEVSNRVIDPLQASVHQSLLAPRLSNVFRGNPHACGIAACILEVATSQPGHGARRVAESVVSLYLSFVSIASRRLVDAYRTLLEGGDPNSPLDSLNKLVDELDHCLDEAKGSPLKDGIHHVLEATMIVRDRRVEEAPLSLDLRLPLACSWELILEEVSSERGSILAAENLDGKQALLRGLADISTETLVGELTEVGKQLGRGIARLALRDNAPEGEQVGLFRKEELWTTHSSAPLSLLYTLNWILPDPAVSPEVRVILLHNGTVSIHVQGDPFFEYMRGNWRYVDVFGKSRCIASFMESKPPSAVVLHASLYRVARLAYHLAYHNHGASIQLDLSSPTGAGENLKTLKARWDVDEILDTGLPLLQPTSASSDAMVPSETGLGRFAYGLCLQDGLSLWSLSQDGTSLRLTDFGTYVRFDPGTVDERWRKRSSDLGIPPESLGGGRHQAAYERSLAEQASRAVFCVSQDGFIDVYIGGDALRLR